MNMQKVLHQHRATFSRCSSIVKFSIPAMDFLHHLLGALSGLCLEGLYTLQCAARVSLHNLSRGSCTGLYGFLYVARGSHYGHRHVSDL